jgi:nucleoside-diphosphate-sugar epimerase
MNKPVATVLGASGGMGHSLVRELVKEGYLVRAVARNGDRLKSQFQDLSSDDVQIHAGDAFQSQFIRETCRDAEVVFHSISLPYQEWEAKQLPMMTSILEGAVGEAKRMVLVHPVYAYGHPRSVEVTEEHPTTPETKKGKIRRQMEQLLEDAHEKGKIEGVIARLPDFYGPYALNTFLNYIFTSILQGKTAYWIGPLDVPREYVYVPDGAKALVRLAQEKSAAGRSWNIPGAGTITCQEIIRLVEETLGKSPKVSSVRKWMLQMLGIMDPMMREMVELYYLFEQSFILSGQQYEKEIGEIPKTPYSEGIQTTLEWLKQQELTGVTR